MFGRQKNVDGYFEKIGVFCQTLNIQVLVFRKDNNLKYNYMKQISFLVILFFTAFSLNAQNSTNNLTPSEMNDFQEAAKNQVERFQKCLEIIGEKSESATVKETYHQQALRLFIGEGKSYKDIYGKEQPPAFMQVSSAKTGTIAKYPIETYLSRLRNLPYAKVKITKAETCRISDLRKVGSHYEGVVTMFQRFVGYNADGPVYQDSTRKNVTIFLQQEEDAWGKKWVVRLGNIEVAETIGF